MSNEKDTYLISLINSARSGDNVAYQMFLEEISLIIERFILKKLGLGTDNEDILQEVLIAVHKSLHTYNSSRSLKNWIFAITDFKINDYLRKYYRNKENLKIGIDNIDIFNTHVTKPISSNELVNELIGKLPEAQKKIVSMMKIEGFSVKQVASYMNMSESAVKVSAHRAYAYLKNLALENKQNES